MINFHFNDLSLRLIFSLSAAAITHTSAMAEDNHLDRANEATQIASVVAESFGKKGAAKVLGKTTKIGTGLSIAQSAKDGDIPGVVGGVVEAGTALITVPTGIVIGSTAAGPFGGVAGGGVGMAIADHRGNQAEEYTRQLIEKYRDKRTDLQKRMGAVGLDHKAFADDFGELRQLGQAAKYEAELRKRLIELEAEDARRRGKAYIPDQVLRQEIAELEDHAHRLEQKANESSRLSESSDQAASEPATIPGASEEPVMADEEVGETDIASGQADEEDAANDNVDVCGPEVVSLRERRFHEEFYANADPNNNNIENMDEVQAEHDECVHTATTHEWYVNDSEVFLKMCENTNKLQRQAMQSRMDNFNSQIEAENNCTFADLPQQPSPPVVDREQVYAEPAPRPELRQVEKKQIPSERVQTQPTETKKWIFKPPRLWLDKGPFLGKLDAN